MHFQSFNSYLSTEDILTLKQYGFRSGSSTPDCLVDLIEEITATLHKGDCAVSLFLDLSKAFDTITHQIALNKLTYYGIVNRDNNWFRSYLDKRNQRSL